MSKLELSDKMSQLELTHAKNLEDFKAILTEKNIYSPSEHSEFLLYRFLRARKYDLEKATEMFTNYINWRKSENVDELCKTFTFSEAQKLAEIYPQFYHKTDKQGRTVYIEQLKNLDVSKVMAITTQDRLISKHIREYEKFTRYRLAACSAKMGKNVENGFTIIDLKGVPLSQFNQVRKMLGSLSSIASDYYPETLGVMFAINAPTLFTAVWSIVKNMLDEHTVSKIHILGSNYKEQLLKHVDAANLPKIYGGECECPGGCEKSDIGPWNDGTVKGFPIAEWEGFRLRDQG